VGIIPLTEKQAERLELPSRTRISPLLEKCCLRVSANESYQKAEEEIEALTGIKVGHTTLHRLVERAEFSPPDAKSAITEVSVDGGAGSTTKRNSHRLSMVGVQGSTLARNLLQCCFYR
jgi:hypothetical protein